MIGPPPKKVYLLPYTKPFAVGRGPACLAAFVPPVADAGLQSGAADGFFADQVPVPGEVVAAIAAGDVDAFTVRRLDGDSAAAFFGCREAGDRFAVGEERVALIAVVAAVDIAVVRAAGLVDLDLRGEEAAAEFIELADFDVGRAESAEGHPGARRVSFEIQPGAPPLPTSSWWSALSKSTPPICSLKGLPTAEPST